MKAKEIFQYILGALVVLGFFTLIGLLSFLPVPTENKDLLNLVVGTLIGTFATVVGYFYGSSLGSAKKDDLMRRQ